MTPALAWFRIDFRQRWKSILVLGLLIAFAAATILTAWAGARRASSVIDRLSAETLPLTVVALPNEPGFDWDAIAALPEVEAVGQFAVSEFSVDEVPFEDESLGFPVLGSDIYSKIEKPVVIEGRLLDPSRVDEVMATPLFLEHYGLKVGDTITQRLLSPEQIDQVFYGDDLTDPPAGPAIPATIVGSIRSLWFSDGENPEGGLTPSPALFETYAEYFAGNENPVYVNAMIRLTGGAASIPQFKADLARVSGREDIDVWDFDAQARDVKDVTLFEARSLMVFVVAALVAALFLVGQAVARHTSSVVSDLEPLRAVGMTPAEVRTGAVLGPLIASAIGLLVGVPLAYAASGWFPVGTASWYEPSPGLDADWLVFGLGLILVPMLVISGSWLAAYLASGSRRTNPSRSVIASQLAQAGMPVPVVVGSRFALESGRGSASIPVRPALFGVIFGVLGIVAVFTFASGIDDTIENPARFGQTWDLAVFLGFNGQDFAPVEDVEAQLSADPDISAVNNTRLDVAQFGGSAVSLETLDPVASPLDVVLTKGELAAGPGEVTLAPDSAKAAGLDVGDVITVAGKDGNVELTVTGLGFTYPSPHNAYSTGGWVTPATYDSLFDGFKFHMIVLDLVPGADVGAVAGRLGDQGIDATPNTPIPEMRQLLQVQVIPWFLAGFLTLLAVGAVGHALATAVRRRQHDLAVLRAVGMTRPQSRGVVVTQATTLALVGLAVGIPLGIALGRTVWRYVADITPVYYVPPVAWLALLLVAPLSLLVANLLAVRPSRRAAKLRLGEVLRTE
jgi:hypothetical protein